MSVKIGCTSARSDTRKFAKCGKRSYLYCRDFGQYCYDLDCEWGINKKRQKKQSEIWHNIQNK